jgi:hypothetical protein
MNIVLNDQFLILFKNDPLIQVLELCLSHLLVPLFAFLLCGFLESFNLLHSKSLSHFFDAIEISLIDLISKNYILRLLRE